MPDEVIGQGTEDVTSEAPTDFREYATWRATGELPEAKENTPAAAGTGANATETQAETAPDSEPENTQEAEEDNEPSEAGRKNKPGSRERKLERALAELEVLKRQVAEKSVTPQDKPPEPAQSAPGKPKLEDFQTLEAYQEALTDWKLDERERLQREKQARDATEQALRAEQDGWKAKERAARKAHPDYDDLMDTVEIPAGPGVLAARQAMLEDEHGAELLYHLAKHPKELERIAALPPASAVMAIGRLSASLSPASPENGKPKITGAPKPPPPSGRQGKTVSDSPDDPDVQRDFPRWAKARMAQLKGR